MENDFSFFELTLIRSLLSKKSAEYIAGLLHRDVIQVTELITLLTKSGRKSYAQINEENVAAKEANKASRAPTPAQLQVIERRRLRDEERQRKEAKRLEDQKRKNLDNAGFEKRKQAREKRIPTRKINLEGTIRVQLNAKTIVWVKPGTDVEKLKKDLKIS